MYGVFGERCFGSVVTVLVGSAHYLVAHRPTQPSELDGSPPADGQPGRPADRDGQQASQRRSASQQRMACIVPARRASQASGQASRRRPASPVGWPAGLALGLNQLSQPARGGCRDGKQAGRLVGPGQWLARGPAWRTRRPACWNGPARPRWAGPCAWGVHTSGTLQRRGAREVCTFPHFHALFRWACVTDLYEFDNVSCREAEHDVRTC